MQLTKYTHSCVVLEKGDCRLVIDPGIFSEVTTALRDATAVLVTHEHADHVATEPLRDAMRRDDALTLYAPAAVVEQFVEFGDRCTVVASGQSFDVKGFGIRTFGGQHALIHPRIQTITNIAYLIDDLVFHPGDSFTVPPKLPQLLLVPVSAPWAKLQEVIDYVIAVRPRRALGIHEAVYSPAGLGIVRQQLTPVAQEFGTEFSLPEPATTLDV